MVPPRKIDLPAPQTEQNEARKSRDGERYFPGPPEDLYAHPRAALRYHAQQQHRAQQPVQQKQRRVVLERHRRLRVLEGVVELLRGAGI